MNTRVGRGAPAGGGLFADLDIDTVGLSHLVRLSFDGYGYRATNDKVTRLPLDESQMLVKFIDTDDVNRVYSPAAL